MNDAGQMNFSHKFKESRKYRKYHHDGKLVDEILSYFKTNDEKTYRLTELAVATNVDAKVLSKWRLAYKKDPTYRPGGRFGMHRRRGYDPVFTSC